MLHLTLAANVMNAVGGTPDLTGVHFVPRYPAPLPDGENDFIVDLQPFSAEAVETFLKIERPAQAPTESARLVALDPQAPPTLLDSPTDPGMRFYSIGEFYEEIIRGLRSLSEQYGEGLFTGDRARQVTAEYFYSGGGTPVPVTDLNSAIKALSFIAEQGEGRGGGIYDHGGELAHYYRFQQLKLGRYYQKGDNGPPERPRVRDRLDGGLPGDEKPPARPLPGGLGAVRRRAPVQPGLRRLPRAPHRGLFRPPRPAAAGGTGDVPAPRRHDPADQEPRPRHSWRARRPHLRAGRIRRERRMSGDGDLAQHFIGFSAEVTAFSAFDLYGTGHAEVYQSVVTRVAGEAVLTGLLDAYDRAVAASAEAATARAATAAADVTAARSRALAAEVFSDEKLGPVARNIIKLWYTGIWYELPTAWTDAFGALANDGTFTASPQAYPEALLWRAVGANPRARGRPATARGRGRRSSRRSPARSLRPRRRGRPSAASPSLRCHGRGDPK